MMPSSMPLAYLRATRPHQWIKNTLVFLPALLAQQLDPETLSECVRAFIEFCLLAAGVYVLNDLLDLATDREHARKRNRPFASGEIPVQHGRWMVAGFFAAGLAVAMSLGLAALVTALVYVGLTTAYSISLKHRFFVDICTLATLYTLRVIAGAAATHIALSVWLVLFCLAFFFSLAAVKRLAELVDGPASGRPQGSGHDYDVEDLPLVEGMAVVAAVASVLILMFHLFFNAPQGLFTTPLAKWGSCLVLFAWLGRIILAARRGKVHDDPVLFTVKDWISWLCLGLIGALAYPW